MKVVPVHLSGVYSKTNRNEVVLSFFCQVTGGSAHLTDEADKIKYFELERIPGNIVPKQIECIKDFFADKAKTYYKVQTGPSAVDFIDKGHM